MPGDDSSWFTRGRTRAIALAGACAALFGAVGLACHMPPDPHERVPVTGSCAASGNEPCSVEQDHCVVGGCGDQWCYNELLAAPPTSCVCDPPAGALCGCVQGRCGWYRNP